MVVDILYKCSHKPNIIAKPKYYKYFAFSSIYLLNKWIMTLSIKNRSNTCMHVIPHYVSYYHSVKCEFKTERTHISRPLY